MVLMEPDLDPIFPANIGSVDKNGYWNLQLETDKCWYYDLNTDSGIPEYIADQKKRDHMSLKFVKWLGGGGGGLALKVLDLKKEIVLKVALDNFMSVRERTIGAFINRWVLTGRTSPNFVRSLFELICKGLPPAEGKWREIVEEIQQVWVPKFKKGALHPLYRTGPPAVSYIGLELGTGGDLFTFSNGNLGKDMVASLSYQMLFGLAALHEVDVIHGDIQDQNVVISRFWPQRYPDVPLYRLQYYDTKEWIYADPYLTLFNSEEKNSYQLGVIERGAPTFFYTIKFIDYGASQRLPEEDPQVRYLHRFTGIIESGSPEALFIDRDPVEVVEEEEELEDSSNLMVPYSKATEIWSIGLVIATLVLSGEHLFMDSSKSTKGEMRPWLFFAPIKVFNAMKSIYTNKTSQTSIWMKQYMYSDGNIDNGIHLMWNMVEALGLPRKPSKKQAKGPPHVEHWPGITKSLLFKVIRKYRKELKYGRSGGWVRGDFKPKQLSALLIKRRVRIHQVLGIEGRRMLFNTILVWDPEKRSPAFLIAAIHPYFDRIREAGKRRYNARSYVEDNTWGFQENWWLLRQEKALLNKRDTQEKEKMKKGKGKVHPQKKKPKSRRRKKGKEKVRRN